VQALARLGVPERPLRLFPDVDAFGTAVEI